MVNKKSWERWGDSIALLLYSCVVLFTVRYHEKWADEAQAWLIARDLDLKTIWFHELRYEGHPGLWHTILWTAQRVLHMPYGALGYMGAVFAIAGVGLLLFRAPFPWYLRWPLAFTYVMVYQYAVIARPYTLLPLLCFLVAILFKDLEHPERITAALVALIMLTLHGTILAVCFGALYLLAAFQSWSALDQRVRARYFLCAGVIVFAFLLLFVILKPTPDVEEFAAKKEVAQFSAEKKQELNIVSPFAKVMTITSGAFLDFFVPSAVFLALTAGWFLMRRRFLVFALPVAAMIAVYAVIHGAPHHHGTAFIAFLTALWIAWPTAEEQRRFTAKQTWATWGMAVLLGCLCVVNISDSAVAIRHEYLYPYSGGEDAARYLKSVGADHTTVFGVDYGVVAIQPYFDHNIFANTSSAYFHHGWPPAASSVPADLLERVKPEYIVVFTHEPTEYLQLNAVPMANYGYQVVHFSDGYYLYKQAVFERQACFIFRRTGESDVLSR